MSSISAPSLSASHTPAASVDISRKALPPLDSLGQSDGIAIVNELLVLMREVLKKMRDVTMDARMQLDRVAFTRLVTSLETKREANATHFQAGKMAAVGQITGGVVGMAGAGFGGFKTFKGSEWGSAVGQVTGQGGGIINGAFQWKSNDLTNQAKDTEVVGEFESGLAEESRRGHERAHQNVDKLSADLRETTKTLTELIGRMYASMQRS